MFVWKVRSLKAESGGCSQPSMTVLGDRPGVGIARQERVTARVWSQLPEITIDHGIMEHAERVAVVRPTSAGRTSATGAAWAS